MSSGLLCTGRPRSPCSSSPITCLLCTPPLPTCSLSRPPTCAGAALVPEAAAHHAGHGITQALDVSH